MSRIRSIPEVDWKKDGEAWGRARTNLYLIQEGADGPVKVGVAGHPIRRLLSLQTGNYRRLHLRAVFEGTERDCVQVERFLLRYFDGTEGEWVFARPDDVVRVINAFGDT